MRPSIVPHRFPGISNRFYKHLRHPPSTQHMSSSLMPNRPHLLKSGVMQVLSVIRRCSGCYRWHPHPLHRIRCRSRYDKELQGAAHTKLPCCLFLWPSIYIFFIWLGGICVWFYSLPWCMLSWFLYSKWEVLPGRRWFCLVRCTACPISQFAISFEWMGSCLKCVSLTFLEIYH